MGLYKAAITTSRALRWGRPSTLLPSKDIAVGDARIGLASSGVHSNGFSLVRNIVENSGLGFYCAGAVLSWVMTLGARAAPTRLYVKSCLRAIRETGAIQGVSGDGGGFTDNIPRGAAVGVGIFHPGARLPVLPVFKWLAAQRASPSSNCSHLQLRHRHDRDRQAGRDRAGDGNLDRKRRDRRPARRSDPGGG